MSTAILDSIVKFCPGNPVFLPLLHATTGAFLAGMPRGMVTDINNDGGGYKNNFMPSDLRVVGNGGSAAREASIRSKEADGGRERARERAGRKILFSGTRERERGTMPLTLDVFVNVNTSSADRHVNVTVDHARERKKKRKGKRENAKKFAWGLMPI